MLKQLKPLSIREVLLETVNKDGLTTLIGDEPQFLKLKANGSVTIHPVKERMYTLEEIKNTIACSAFIEGRKSNIPNIEVAAYFEKWFNKNYSE